MSDIIKLLPDSVANQIAAGEVIQRPASVIKELVENAADARATEILIYIKDAGRSLIQVIDNGIGMSETDARMAFERHATSKIRKADDLFTLHSMGFRGEALPSICAISQLEIRTRPREAAIGTRILIEGSNVTLQEPDVCEPGTSIAVRNLFFNVPARRKFLKSDTVELANIMREFERLALVNNNIRMRIETGSKIIDLPAGSFRQRIEALWKNNLKAELVPVEIDTSLVKITGFMSRPEYARRRNPLQFLMVNGRNMRHPYFHKAILNCYEPLIAADTQPCYFIKFEVDPATIDINIHPTKNEIKFEYEAEIWKLLSTAIKSALGMFSAVPSIDFDTEIPPVARLEPGEKSEAPEVAIPEGYNPFNTNPKSPFANNKAFNPFSSATKGGAASSDMTSGHSSAGIPSSAGHAISYRREKENPPANWETLYSKFLSASIEDAPSPQESLSLDEDERTADGSLRPSEAAETGRPICFQVGLKYIVTSSRDGLIIIDQHRAHTKILYNRFRNEMKGNARVSQPVLFPESIILDTTQQTILGGIREDLDALGYRLEPLSEEEWAITGVPPAEKGVGQPRDVIMRIIESISEDSANYGNDATPREAIQDRTMLLLARASAITGGRRLTPDEIEHLVGELFRLPDPALTPDGHHVYTLLDPARLAQLLP